MEEKRRSLISIAVTLVVVILLLISGYVSAVQVHVSTDKSSYRESDEVIFTVSVDIEQGERIPVHNLTLRVLNSSNNVVRECTFGLNGSFLTSCANIRLNASNTTGMGYSTMYGYGYGYGYGGWGYVNQSFGFGYGYGYSAGYAALSGELSYRLVWNLSAENLTEGSYSADFRAHAAEGSNYRIYASDDEYTLTYDVTAPGLTVGRVGTIYDQNPTLAATTTENATCRFRRTGSFADFSTTGGTYHTQQLNLAVGSFTYYVNCSDAAGNYGDATYGFTIERQSGGGGGGSSSGFVIFPEVVIKQDVPDYEWKKITAGSPVVLFIAQERMPVTKIRIVVPVDAANAGLSVKTVELPFYMQGLTEAYQYLKIDGFNFPDGTEATISFKVPRWWLIENKFDAEDVGLYKFRTEWTLLPTKYISRDKLYTYYEAETEGFSYFAVARIAEEIEPVAPPPTAEVVSETPPVSEPLPEGVFPLWPFALIIAAVFISLGVLAYHLHERAEPIAREIVRRLDPMQRAVDSAKRWILVAHMKGRNNLVLHQRLVARGWPKELAKKLILEVAGPDRVEDPIDTVKELIAEALSQGRSRDDVRMALEHAGWPAWKIDELLA
jgi:PGF-pre-PGF domain-containing protein